MSDTAREHLTWWAEDCGLGVVSMRDARGVVDAVAVLERPTPERPVFAVFGYSYADESVHYLAAFAADRRAALRYAKTIASHRDPEWRDIAS
jgi:hypothetical protein